MPTPSDASRLHAASCACGATHVSRRAFLRGGAALAAGLAAPQLWAQPTPQAGIRSLRGLVRINGEKAGSRTPVKVGDTVLTGANGNVSFVVGSDAFFLRENSELKIAGAGSLIDSLRMVSGALGAVFGKRATDSLQLHTPTVTAGIRGTGCYAEVLGEGTYFCTCFGSIELQSQGSQQLVEATRHNARSVPRGGVIQNASMMGHTDQEMDALERLVGRRAPWAT